MTNPAATINRARLLIVLAALLWSREPKRGRAPGRMDRLPATTAESEALSKELRREGFRFVGPTTVYSAMQSLGVVNDHLTGCHFRAEALAERARFTVPR